MAASLVVCLFLFLFAAVPLRAADDCPSAIDDAVSAARSALQDGSAEGKHHALQCLIEAVGNLNARLDDLIAGRIAFDKVTSKGGLFPAASAPASEAE